MIPRRELDTMGIVFPDEIDGENQNTRYVRLFNREVTPTSYADDTTLRELGLYSSVRWMLGNLGMADIFSMSNPTYVRPTYEFPSSFQYATPFGGSHIYGIAKFRMFDTSYVMSQDQITEQILRKWWGSLWRRTRRRNGFIHVKW